MKKQTKQKISILICIILGFILSYITGIKIFNNNKISNSRGFPIHFINQIQNLNLNPEIPLPPEIEKLNLFRFLLNSIIWIVITYLLINKLKFYKKIKINISLLIIIFLGFLISFLTAKVEKRWIGDPFGYYKEILRPGFPISFYYQEECLCVVPQIKINILKYFLNSIFWTVTSFFLTNLFIKFKNKK